MFSSKLTKNIKTKLVVETRVRGLVWTILFLVVRIAEVSINQGGAMLTGHLKVGDEVWVRGRKGYPIEVDESVRLFVFNEWDVAINLGSGGVSADQPPTYSEKMMPY
ncbi:unnamed protein product [Meloidogyne enterolobii]|uniref:Uncharacterized protein n=1 Tax=Meloidogyne enterolobii TaxID=390850 RepID=A0ACB1AB19_MELEN